MTGADGITHEYTLEGNTTAAAVPVTLPAGVSRLELCCPDPASVDMRWGNGVPYQLLLMLAQPNLKFVAPGAGTPLAAGCP